MKLISNKIFGSLQVWVRALLCSNHKGTNGQRCKLIFFKSSVTITGFRSVQLILGHYNENSVVLKHYKCINIKILISILIIKKF